jgi:hypothetical protein
MSYYTDELGRSFIDLSTLSELLGLSKKQVHRHIRNKRLLSIRRGQARFILKDDILREYPAITPTMLNRDMDKDIGDTIGTSTNKNSVLDAPNVPLDQAIDIYRQDKKQDLIISQVEQVKGVVSELQRALSDFRYVAQDTKALDRKLDRLNDKVGAIKGQKGHKGQLVGFVVLGLVILGLITVGTVGINKFKDFYQRTKSDYEAMLKTKDRQIDAIGSSFNQALYEHIREKGQKDLEIENLRTMNEQLGETVKGLQGKRK